MPNWCENDLRVTGPREYLQAFLDHVEGPKLSDDTRDSDYKFDFDKIIPYPESFRKMDEESAAFKGDWKDRPKDGFNSGGYEWCIQHWGTKWKAHSVRVDHNIPWIPDEEADEEAVMIHFDTAWSPPMPVIEMASIMFPMLTFDLRYFESGCAFNGVFQVKGGQVIIDECGKYFGNRGG